MNKLKPKEKRDLLFKNGRPNIRPIELEGEDGLGSDFGILWAAYKKGSFEIPEEMTQEEFAEYFINVASQYTRGWIVEDNNKSFSNNYGAVGLILAVNDNWQIEPHFDKFTWSTNRNTLRTCVAFFQMMRYDKTVGIVNAYARDKVNASYFKRLSSYGVLNYSGVVPNGDIQGDKYIFYIRGNKK